MVNKNSEVIYSNIEIDPDKAYFLFVGDMRFVHSSHCLSNELSKRYKKPVEAINVLSNRLPPYTDGNFIVVNPGLADYVGGKSGFMPLCSEEKIEDRNEYISESPYIRRIIDKILKNQPDLFIDLYKSTQEMTLHEKDERIRIIGPEPELVRYFDNKINQRLIAEEIGLSVPEGYIARSTEELISLYREYFPKDAFVTASTGFGGNGSEKISCPEDLVRSEKLKDRDQFIISEFLDLRASSSSLGIVANEDEVLVVQVADQIMKGVEYRGTIFPSEAGPEKVERMREYAEMIGSRLGRKGYRGFFGVDFMIDQKGRVYFGEINPRKTAATPGAVLAHRMEKPGIISLPELEFVAVTESTFGQRDLSYYDKFPSIGWGVSFIAGQKGQTTLNYIPSEKTEEEIFSESGVTTLYHPGEGVVILGSGIFAGIICVQGRESGEKNRRENMLRKMADEKKKTKLI